MLTSILGMLIAFLIAAVAWQEMAWYRRRRAGLRAPRRYTILFDDPSSHNATWCTYESLDAANEAIAALNAVYGGQKSFRLQPPPPAVISSGGDHTVNGQVIRLAEQKDMPIWKERALSDTLREDERRRHERAMAQPPFISTYRRNHPLD